MLEIPGIFGVNCRCTARAYVCRKNESTTPTPHPESAKADFTFFLRLELLYSILLTRNVVVGGGRFLHCLENFTLVNEPLIAPHHLVMIIINSNLVVHIIK